MIGKIAAAVIGSKIGKQTNHSPVAGAVIGAVSLAAARRFLPARFAVIGATVAGGYLTKKWADRQAAKSEAMKVDPTGTGLKSTNAGIADNFQPTTEPTPVLTTPATDKGATQHKL